MERQDHIAAKHSQSSWCRGLGASTSCAPPYAATAATAKEPTPCQLHSLCTFHPASARALYFSRRQSRKHNTSGAAPPRPHTTYHTNAHAPITA